MVESKNKMEMTRLLSPEGLKELQSKIGPVTLSEGMEPHPDGRQYTESVDPRPVEDRIAVPLVKGPSMHIRFSLAPVYFAVKIPFDLISQFLNSEYGKGAVVTRIRMDHEFMPDIPGWTSVLETIDPEHWDKLVLFLGECAFQRGNQIWTICGDMVLLTKPRVESIAVFTPRDLATRLRPYVEEDCKIRFSRESIVENITDSDFVRKIRNLEQGVRA